MNLCSTNILSKSVKPCQIVCLRSKKIKFKVCISNSNTSVWRKSEFLSTDCQDIFYVSFQTQLLNFKSI